MPTVRQMSSQRMPTLLSIGRLLYSAIPQILCCQHTGLTNTGLTNTGLTNTGLTNTGLTNTGLTNTGLTNTGLTNTGLTNTGSCLFVQLENATWHTEG